MKNFRCVMHKITITYIQLYKFSKSNLEFFVEKPLEYFQDQFFKLTWKNSEGDLDFLVVKRNGNFSENKVILDKRHENPNFFIGKSN